MSDIDVLKAAIASRWSGDPGWKAMRYVDQFFDRTRRETWITAKVQGNHGIYRVALWVEDGKLGATCSCYIGTAGYCHHCAALGYTFGRDPLGFREIVRQPITAVTTIQALAGYLEGVTLEELVNVLKAQGVPPKTLAEGLGMTSQRITQLKKKELAGNPPPELGAVKAACLWVLEHFGKRAE